MTKKIGITEVSGDDNLHEIPVGVRCEVISSQRNLETSEVARANNLHVIPVSVRLRNYKEWDYKYYKETYTK